MKLNIGESLDAGEKLWRYMTLAKFISLLDQKSLWLARTDTFRDKHEGRFPNEMRQAIEKAFESFRGEPSPIESAADFQDYLVKNTFMSCWHKNLDENIVMWEIYGRRDDAVAIQTSVGAIQNSIDFSDLPGNFLILDNVRYERPEQVEGELRYEQCFFIKRPHFIFEKEVRLCLDTYSHCKPRKDAPRGYKLPLRLSGLVDSVLVHPDSSDWFLCAVESLIKKYDLAIELRRGTQGNE